VIGVQHRLGIRAGTHPQEAKMIDRQLQPRHQTDGEQV
jgi:hypothetical protein